MLDGAGKVVVPTQTVSGDNVQAIAETSKRRAPPATTSCGSGCTDAEGNVGAPVTAPLAYECMRSPVTGGTH